MSRGFKGKSGFTLIEMVIVLSIIATLAAILVPTLIKYTAESQMRRAQRDAQNISGSIGKFSSDTGLWPVSTNFNASGGGTTSKNDIDTLKGPGNDPTNNTTSGWLSTLGGTARTTDDLADQLITNAADYKTTGKRAWSGPYLDRVEEDPWGNAYLVNVKFLQPGQIRNLKSVFVLSAGPDGEIDTPFENIISPNIVEPQDDDIVSRLK
ncbi:MAG: type II secretion system protein GspG [Candidatus Brocadiales bacterium]|nr:type II secretion system protein GspG [Candidatus Bathyanammoxibius sp.]